MSEFKGFKQIAQSLPTAGKSLQEYNNSAHQLQAKLNYAAERTRLLFGQFRKGEANDPATYVAAVAEILSRYPADVIKAVTDPMNGLAAKSDWLPTTHEVVRACETEMEPRRRQAERDEIAENQRRRNEEHERARSAPRTGKVEQYLAERKAQQNITPASPDYILQQYKHWRAMYGKQVTLDPESARILDQAGLEWRHI